jgi:ABC-type uncharacterized transport system ATPase subunit
MLKDIPPQIWIPLVTFVLGVPFAFIYAILRGKLVPKATVDEIRADYDSRAELLERLTEARVTNWKELYEEQKKATQTNAEAMDEVITSQRDLLRSSRIVTEFIQTQRRAIEGGHR